MACAFAVLGCLSSAQAAVRAFYFERAGGAHGLAQNSVTALAQDADGFIWVGTQGGLHRFDGQQYTLYREDPDSADSLPDSFITALASDGGRALWVGTYSQDVARLDLDSGHIRRFGANPDDGNGSASRQVFALSATPDAVYVGTVAGLDRLDPRSGRRTRVLALPPDLLAGQPQALLHDAQGAYWYASAAGLYRLDDSTRPAVRIDGAGALDALLQDRSGRIWAGGKAGLFLVTNRRTLVQAWPREDANDGRDVRAQVEGADGHLWFSVA